MSYNRLKVMRDNIEAIRMAFRLGVEKRNAQTAEEREILGRYWKTQGRMTPLAKVDLTPENILFLTPLEIGRRGQFYFGLSVFEGFELADTFTGKGDAVGGVDNAVEYGIGHSRVTDRIVPVQFGKLGCYDD